MREALMRAAALTGLLLAAILAAIPATITSTLAQTPTQAQRAAIKSQCRSDYMAHCSSIAPGGAASLQCLQKNMASLAPGCQAAVQAVTGSSEAKSEPAKSESKPQTAAAPATEPTAESKAEPAPAATAAAPATAPASKSAGTKKPSNAQVAAIRSACRSDYPKVCAGVPTGGAQARRYCGRACRTIRTSSDSAAADAPAGGTVRDALGLRRRRPHAVRRPRPRRRAHPAMPHQERLVAVAGMPGRTVPVRRAVKFDE